MINYLISLKNISIEKCYELFQNGYELDFKYGKYPYLIIKKGN